MSVEQLKDGRWCCQYPKGKYQDKPNSNKQYFGRGADAEERARAFNKSLGLGIKKTKISNTFTALANAYLTAKQNSMTVSTYQDACIMLERVILPQFGDFMVHNITHRRLDSFVAMRRKTVKNTTVRNDLAMIRAILNFSVKRRLIAISPMLGYEFPKKDNARILPPSRKEIDAVLACASPHIKRAILLTYHTGCRPGKVELLSLTWDSIDFVNRIIMITSADKGGLPVRMVPMSNTIYEALKQWHKEDKEKVVPYIIHYHGKKIDSIKKAWTYTKKRAGITRRLRLYDIRHAFVTSLLEKGADLKSVSEIVGHSSVKITATIYQHVSTSLKRETINLLD